MKTVLFDFDGTIADTMPIVIAAFRSTFQHFLGRHFQDQEIRQLFGPPEIPILKAKIPPHQYDMAFQHYLHAYAMEHQTLRNFPAIMEMLNALHSASLQLGIVTAKGRDSAKISLEQLGLTSFFQLVITGDDVRSPKPDPEGIVMAMEMLGADPQYTVYVGDSNSDVKAAKAANISSVGVNWLPVSRNKEGFTPEPDRTFTDPHAFTEWVLVKKWTGTQ